MQTEQHHRVYNNLNVINKLVVDYGKEIGEEKIQELRNNISAISKVHGQLYKGVSVDDINLHNLFLQISNSFIENKAVTIFIDCHLVTNQIKATPLALLINELITNAIKHNISAKKKIEISIVGHMEENTKKCVIIFKDNGIGFIELPTREKQYTSLGIPLCFGLAKQAKADIFFLNNDGCNCIIKFNPK